MPGDIDAANMLIDGRGAPRLLPIDVTHIVRSIATQFSTCAGADMPIDEQAKQHVPHVPNVVQLGLLIRQLLLSADPTLSGSPIALPAAQRQ